MSGEDHEPFLQTTQSSMISIDSSGEMSRWALWRWRLSFTRFFNSWQPFGYVYGRKNGKRRFFRPWERRP